MHFPPDHGGAGYSDVTPRPVGECSRGVSFMTRLARRFLYTAPMIFSARPLVLPVLLFSLAGCGLKGPLYLPDKGQQQVPVATGTPADTPKPVLEGSKVLTLPPAPQAQKKDRERANSSTAPTQSTPSPTTPSDTTTAPPDPATTPPPGQ